MLFRKGQKVWFIFKENYQRDKNEGYKLIPKEAIFEDKEENGEFLLSYINEVGNEVKLTRNGNAIFDTKDKCEYAITKTYMHRAYNFIIQAKDIFDRYLIDKFE